MDKFHKDIDENNRHAIAKTIPHHFAKDSDKNLVKYFFSNFIEV